MGYRDYETISIGIIEEDKFLKINPILSINSREELIEFSKRNAKLFARRPGDMLGINLGIISHELNVNHIKKQIQQQKMRFTREKKSNIIRTKLIHSKK